MGADRPPNGARQRKFWPLIAHLSMSLVSGETPSRLGPRASGQSPRATLRGPCAEPVSAASVASANARAVRHRFLSIVFIARSPYDTRHVSVSRCTHPKMQPRSHEDAKNARRMPSRERTSRSTQRPQRTQRKRVSQRPSRPLRSNGGVTYFYTLLETHPSSYPERPWCPVLADEPGPRKARIRERDRHVAGVERVADPDLAEGVLRPQAGAKVRQRIGALACGVRVVVFVGAVTDGLGPCDQRHCAAKRPHVLHAEVGGVPRRVREPVAADVDAVRSAAA